MKMKDIWPTEVDQTEGGRYSKGKDYSIRYGENSIASSHEEVADKKWTDKQATETGLTDREKL